MLGNGIKQTSTTAGTGSLTLSAVTGYPKLSDVFPLNFPLSYTLLDSNGLFIEAGIGYLLDASTLVRSRATATMVGGAYVSSSPSAVNLSGTTTVICTPQAATLESMMPTVDSVSVGVQRYLSTAGRNGNTTSVTPSALRASYVPFLLRTAGAVTSLAVNVLTAGAAGTVARCGVYTCNQNGYPGALLTSTGDMDTSTTGFKSGSVTPIMLPPGWYFTASVFSGSPSVSAQTAGGGNYIGGNPLGWSSMTPIDFRYEALASAVLLPTVGLSTGASPGSSHIPLVLMGVQ